MKPLLSFYTLYREEDNEFLQGWIDNVKAIGGHIVIINCSGQDIPLHTSYLNSVYTAPQSHPRYSQEWDQVNLRNDALAMCKGEWTVQLDIDERLHERFKFKFVQHTLLHPYEQAFAIPTCNLWENEEEVRVDGWWFPDLHWRVWRTGTVKYIGGARHCRPNLPEIRNQKTMLDDPRVMPYEETALYHLKYMRPRWYNDKLRCCRKDVESLEEYYKGCRCLKISDIFE